MEIQQLALSICLLASLSLDTSNVLQHQMEAEPGWEVAHHEYSQVARPLQGSLYAQA